ncbi:7875_t:CDS:2 [Ambispora gerdemannii]|uniref:7875_t:CDS:1 n=1 Tax=Ambispora gerdemannii TaxID=144530 RepID=A0A9N9AAC6_9GLOM|nr:7875_t:CDS:2 [Ambispora gerdemannii]
MSNILFLDVFNINDMDRDGKKFDRVSRFVARSENYEMELTLDVNIELYPLDIGDRVSLCLASSLESNPLPTEVPKAISMSDSEAERKRKKEQEEKERDSWQEKRPDEVDLSDEYEYVMFGKVYKYDDKSSKGVGVYISFGGLLMALEGDHRHITNIYVGQNCYLLMKR